MLTCPRILPLLPSRHCLIFYSLYNGSLFNKKLSYRQETVQRAPFRAAKSRPPCRVQFSVESVHLDFNLDLNPGCGLGLQPGRDVDSYSDTDSKPN